MSAAISPNWPATCSDRRPAGDAIRSRLRATALRLLLVLGGLAVGLGLAELAARWYDDARPYLVNAWLPTEGEILDYRPDTRLRWVLDPAHPDHNALGLRDDEMTQRPAPGTERIVVVGDSVPYGIGVLRDEAYPQVLERRLRALGGGPVEVVNAGVPAYTGQQVGLFFEQRALPLGPTRVIVSVTANDLDTLPVIVRDGDELRWEYYEDRHGPDLLEPPAGLSTASNMALWRRSHLYRLILRYRAQQRLGEQAGEGVDLSAKRNLDALIGIHRRCQALGLPVLFVLVPALLDGPDAMWTPRMARIARGLGAAGCPLLDLRQGLLPEGRSLTELRANADDVWHPNAEGHALIAERVAAELVRRGWVKRARLESDPTPESPPP